MRLSLPGQGRLANVRAAGNMAGHILWANQISLLTRHWHTRWAHFGADPGFVLIAAAVNFKKVKGYSWLAVALIFNGAEGEIRDLRDPGQLTYLFHRSFLKLPS